MTKTILGICFVLLVFGWLLEIPALSERVVWVILSIPVVKFLQKILEFMKQKEYFMVGLGVAVIFLIGAGLFFGLSLK